MTTCKINFYFLYLKKNILFKIKQKFQRIDISVTLLKLLFCYVLCHTVRLEKRGFFLACLYLLMINLVPQNLSVFHKWE